MAMAVALSALPSISSLIPQRIEVRPVNSRVLNFSIASKLMNKSSHRCKVMVGDDGYGDGENWDQKKKEKEIDICILYSVALSGLFREAIYEIATLRKLNNLINGIGSLSLPLSWGFESFANNFCYNGITLAQGKKDDMLQYKMERIPFLEEQVRKIREGGKLLTMDIHRLLLSEDNRFDFVNEVAAEAKEYVERNRDEYGGEKKAILHVLSNRMNDAGFYRPDGYAESDPYKPGPGFLKEEFT